nr:YdcF family protein [Myxacorys almedinensis]
MPRCIAFVFVLLGVGYIPTRLAIAQQQAPDPEVILILGGSSDRESFAAQLALQQPQLTIWVSSGSPDAANIFRQAGIPSSQLRFDRRATDTVTNFTTTVSDFKRRGIQHVYVVTSDYHMDRASAIATIVLGSQGIAFTPLSVSGEHRQESQLRVLRDVGRSVVWLVTGRTGASLKRRSLTR